MANLKDGIESLIKESQKGEKPEPVKTEKPTQSVASGIDTTPKFAGKPTPDKKPAPWKYTPFKLDTKKYADVKQTPYGYIYNVGNKSITDLNAQNRHFAKNDPSFKFDENKDYGFSVTTDSGDETYHDTWDKAYNTARGGSEIKSDADIIADHLNKSQTKSYGAKYASKDYNQMRVFPNTTGSMMDKNNKWIGPRYSLMEAYGLDDDYLRNNHVARGSLTGDVYQMPDGTYAGNPRINDASFQSVADLVDFEKGRSDYTKKATNSGKSYVDKLIESHGVNSNDVKERIREWFEQSYLDDPDLDEDEITYLDGRSYKDLLEEIDDGYGDRLSKSEIDAIAKEYFNSQGIKVEDISPYASPDELRRNYNLPYVRYGHSWNSDGKGNITSVKTKNGHVIRLKQQASNGDYVTGFDPETNTVFLSEDPTIDGGRDYSIEDVEDLFPSGNPSEKDVTPDVKWNGNENSKVDEFEESSRLANNLSDMLKRLGFKSPYIDINTDSVDVGAESPEQLANLKKLLDGESIKYEDITGGYPTYYGVRVGVKNDANPKQPQPAMSKAESFLKTNNNLNQRIKEEGINTNLLISKLDNYHTTADVRSIVNGDVGNFNGLSNGEIMDILDSLGYDYELRPSKTGYGKTIYYIPRKK